MKGIKNISQIQIKHLQCKDLKNTTQLQYQFLSSMLLQGKYYWSPMQSMPCYFQFMMIWMMDIEEMAYSDNTIAFHCKVWCFWNIITQYSFYVTFLPMLIRSHTTARSYTDDKRNERFGCSEEQLVPFKLTWMRYSLAYVSWPINYEV